MYILDWIIKFVYRFIYTHQGYTSYESYNYPDYFIRHQNYVLKISLKENPASDLYKMDASFAEIEGS